MRKIAQMVGLGMAFNGAVACSGDKGTQETVCITDKTPVTYQGNINPSTNQPEFSYEGFRVTANGEHYEVQEAVYKKIEEGKDHQVVISRGIKNTIDQVNKVMGDCKK